MTRDEAKKIYRTYDNISGDQMEDNLTLWSALGMLKFDDPKITNVGLHRQGASLTSPSELAKLTNVLNFLKPTATALELKYWLETSGLKITEK